MLCRAISWIFLLVISSQAIAADGEFAVSKIPPELLSSANAVIRMEELRFEIINLVNTREYRKLAITIMNENGNKFAALAQNYDQLVSIESIDGAIYDASGKKTRSLKKSEILDQSASGDDNLTDDNRIKYHNFYERNYPYTVVYEITVRNNFTMFFPSWNPISDEDLAVQDSKLTVICTDVYKFRYKAFNYSQEPIVTSEKSKKSYTWEVKNLTAIKDEVASPPWWQIAPFVYLAPVDFEIQGYKGSMQTWKDLGKMQYALNKDRDVLPSEIKVRVHQIADPLRDKKEKVTRLYEFMQENTRYISVQLGIGGWQPFNATAVAAKKYGDCKALSNYMYSLLKEAGIKSCYTLINAGQDSRPLIEDFPSRQFGHVILCVPLEKDTIWLECTSQTLPAGYLSGFTQNRLALLVDETGGTLARTPHYSANENLQTRKVSASLNEEGLLNCTVSTRYAAMQQDDLEYLVSLHKREKLNEKLKTNIDIPTYDILSFDYELQKSRLPVVLETIQIVAPNYAQSTGKRMFINPNILSKSGSRIEAEPDRKYPLRLTMEYRDIDTVTINVPAGLKPESIPAELEIKSPFGTYLSKTTFINNQISYYRMVERYAGEFPPSEYASLRAFYEKIFKADHANVVLIKN